MKSKRYLAVISFALAALMALPVGVMAKENNKDTGSKGNAAAAQNANGLNKISNAINSAELANLRNQVKALNAQIVADKKYISQTLGAISKDLAGAKNVASIAGSDDYKTVQTNLSTIKTDVKNANAIKYKNALGTVKGNQSDSAKDTVNNVIAQMTQKLNLLDQAKALADTTKAIADQIYTQKQAELAAWQAFHDQAVQLKQTIDATHAQIATLNEASKTLINQIVATFTANASVLASNPTGLAQIQTQLSAVKDALSTEYDGKISAASKQYETDKQNKDYNKAIADLNAIISLQNNRLTVLQSVQTQLTDILNSLNALVQVQSSSSSSSSATSATSSTVNT